MPSIKIWCLCGRAALVPEHLWGLAKKCPACLRVVQAPHLDAEGRITQTRCPACQHTVSISPGTDERVVLCDQGHIVRVPVLVDSSGSRDEEICSEGPQAALQEAPALSSGEVLKSLPVGDNSSDAFRESLAESVAEHDGAVSPEEHAGREERCIDCGAVFQFQEKAGDQGQGAHIRCERCESAFHIVLASSNPQVPVLGKSTTPLLKPDQEGKCIDCGVALAPDDQSPEPGATNRIRCDRCESAFHIALVESTGLIPAIGKSSWLKPRSAMDAGRRETCVDCGAPFIPREVNHVRQVHCEKCEQNVRVVVATSDAQLPVVGEFDSRDRIVSIDDLLDREPPTIAPLRPRTEGAAAVKLRSKAERDDDANWNTSVVLPLRKRRSRQGEPICGAGFWHRLLCYMVDAVPIFIVVTLFAYFQLGFDQTLHQFLTRNPGDEQARIDFLIERNRIRDFAFALYLVYSALCDCSPMQGTLAKRLCGLVVVDADGHPISWRRSIVRNAAKLLSALPFFLGFLWIAFSADKRAWHDWIAGTYVVEE